MKPIIVVYNVDEDALDATIEAPGFTVITVPAFKEADGTNFRFNL